MREGWQIKPLGEVCKIDKRQGIYAGLPYVGMENIESHTARFLGTLTPQEVKSSTFRFCPEHVLYGRLRPYLNKVMAPDFEGHCSTEVFPIKPNTFISREYLLYWFLRDWTVSQIDATCTGARMPRANMSDVMALEFAFPSLPEQQRIVALLDEAFDGIATAKANAEQNLKNARELFESHLQAVFTQRGEGWVEKRLDDVGTTQTGSTPKTSEPENYGTHIPFIKPADFNVNGSLEYEKDGLSEVGRQKARIVRAGSALMVCIGATIGKAGFSDRDVATNQQINALTSRNDVSHKFVYYQMITADFQRRVLDGSAQATLPIINKSKWSSLTVALPPTLQEQLHIVAKLDALLATTHLLESLYQQKLAALDELKKSLLHKAFNGEL